jgi:uncharacterized membrane protein
MVRLLFVIPLAYASLRFRNTDHAFAATAAVSAYVSAAAYGLLATLGLRAFGHDYGAPHAVRTRRERMIEVALHIVVVVAAVVALVAILGDP